MKNVYVSVMNIRVYMNGVLDSYKDTYRRLLYRSWTA